MKGKKETTTFDNCYVAENKDGGGYIAIRDTEFEDTVTYQSLTELGELKSYLSNGEIVFDNYKGVKANEAIKFTIEIKGKFKVVGGRKGKKDRFDLTLNDIKTMKIIE